MPFRDYMVGSFFGLTPGIVIISLFAYQLENAIRNPGLAVFTLLVALVGITIIATALASYG